MCAKTFCASCLSFHLREHAKLFEVQSQRKTFLISVGFPQLAIGLLFLDRDFAYQVAEERCATVRIPCRFQF